MRVLLEDAECGHFPPRGACGDSAPCAPSAGFSPAADLSADLSAVASAEAEALAEADSMLGEGRLANERAPLHAAVVLGRRERIAARELVEGDPAVEAECFGASDRERVEPNARTDATHVRPAITERQGDHAVRHARKDRDGKLERAARVIETDQIPAGKTERLGVLRAHERRVVPGDLRSSGSGSSCSHPSFAKRPS